MRGPQVFLFDEALSNLDAELRVQTRVEQIGAPMQLYDDPDNVFVAGFISSPRMHFLSAVVTAQGLDLGGITLPLPDLRSTPAIGTSVRLGIRPEHLDQTQGVRLPATVEVVERLGGTAFVHARLGNGQTIIAEQRDSNARAGVSLDLHFDAARARLFDAAGARLR